VITDPRTIGDPPKIEEPDEYILYTQDFLPPAPNGDKVELYFGPNIVPPPPVKPLAESLSGRVLLKLGDNISTDHILPGGNDVLPLRSNIRPSANTLSGSWTRRSTSGRKRPAEGLWAVGITGAWGVL